jgi:hypothetical protein
MESQQSQSQPWSTGKKFGVGSAAAIGLSPIAYQLANYFAPEQTQSFMGGLKNFLFGGQESQFDDEQLSALAQLLQGGQNQLNDPYQGFGDIENYATQNFNQQVVPGLAERFAGSGSNASSSPIFAQQLGQAGQQFSQGLGALKAQYGQQNRAQGLQQIQMGLTPNKTQNVPGFLNGPLLGQLLQGGAKAGLGYASGGLL